MSESNSFPAGVPNLPDQEMARRLAARFAQLGVSMPGLLKHFGVQDEGQLAAMPDGAKAARISEPTAFNAIVRLFLRCSACDDATVRLAFPDIPMEQLEAQGVIVRHDGQVFGGFQLHVAGDVLAAADSPRALGGTPEDMVTGISGADRFVGDLGLRRTFGKALELRAGQAYLSLLAAKHCQSVVAVDSNPRAAAYTKFNALIRGCTNLEAAVGSGIDAVRGQTFDYIFGNPPVEIRPGSRGSSRELGSELRGDEYARSLIRSAAGLLNPGGYLQMMFDLPLRPGEDARQPLAAWFDGLSCDVLVYRIKAMDVKSYVMSWVRQEATDQGIQSAEAIDGMLRTWAEFMQSQKLASITTMFVTLRRRDEWEAAADRKPWMLADEGNDRVVSPMSDHILRVFANMDFLVGSDEQKVAATRFRASPDVRLRQELALNESGGWQPSENAIRMAGGFGRGAAAPTAMTNLLVMCDGQRTTAEIIGLMAQAAKQPVDKVAPQMMAALRGLLERGIVSPVA